MNNELNIFQKLNKCRTELQAQGLKKNGYNVYKNFEYFELSDFLPSVNKLCNDYGLFTQFDMGADFARLEVLNCENPAEKIAFTLPVFVKEGAAMQDIGAFVTYARRYLLMIAFEICEADIIDANIDITADNCQKKAEYKKPAKKKAEPTPAQPVKHAAPPAPAEEESEDKKELRKAWQEARKAGLTNADIEHIINYKASDLNEELYYSAAVMIRQYLQDMHLS